MRTIILGGGPSGLAIARSLPSPVILLESSPRVGGWIHSVPRLSGHLFEQGPHSLRPRQRGNGLRVVDLVRELDLKAEVLINESDERFVFTNGKLIRLPASFTQVITHELTWTVPWKFAREFFAPRILDPGDRSLGSFVDEKFGEQGRVLIGAIVAGVFAGDLDALSTEACFPDLMRWERLGNGSIARGALKSAMAPASKTKHRKDDWTSASGLSFKHGMGTFAKALYDDCVKRPNVTIKTNAKAVRVERNAADKTWTVHTESGESYQADVLISTLTPEIVQNILPTSVPELDRLVDGIGRVDVAVVNLRYDSKHLKLPSRKAFGHLVAKAKDQEENGVLGIIYDSNAFPAQQPINDDSVVLSVMLGGANAPWVAIRTEAEWIKLATDAVRLHLKCDHPPEDSLAVLHRKCIPQYRVGHAPRAVALRDRFRADNFLFLGTGVLGAGIADSVGGSLFEIDRLKWTMGGNVTK